MRKNKQGGFTLIEMLIVVAIIAILVAVSIPLVSSALERARVATDAANERACKAELLICYLTEKLDGTNAFTPGTVYSYDADAGKLVTAGSVSKGYGKCTSGLNHKDKVLNGKVDLDGTVTLGWANKDSASDPNATTLHGTDLDNTTP